MKQVSIVIPLFNQQDYITETLESVAAQTFKDWECIIVDDGSTDASNAVALDFINKQPDSSKYKLLSKPNGGPAAARNFGISAATDSYILPLDSDDTIHPQALERMARVLTNNLSIDIVGCDTRRFGLDTSTYSTCDYMEQQLTTRGNFMNYCSMYRKSVWEKVGGYDEELVVGHEDWDFWLKCAEQKFKLRHLPVTLFNYRIRPDGRLAGLQNDPESYRKILAKHNLI